MKLRARIGILAAAVLALAAALVLLLPRPTDAFALESLVSDTGPTATHDPGLVNGWGLAASETGPWWTTSEAGGVSPLYAADGRKQALTVQVEGGPTGVVYNGGGGFLVHGGGRTGTARFIYACEDGSIRGWAPTVPQGWSETAVVAVSGADTGAIFRGLALARLPDGAQRLYATDFHNDKVLVYDSAWRPVATPGGFVDAAMPAWFAPFGIQAIGNRVFVTYAGRAPVNGNDAPTGGYVDEFDLQGRLIARVGSMGELHEPWGVARAPQGFGRFAGDILVANFGTGRITAFRRHGDGWSFDGHLPGRNGKPLVVQGIWGMAFGRGGMSGPKDTLFFAAGPHGWRGDTETSVHGLFGSISRIRS
ncbi:MAG: hypothetical protein QOH73_1949 [Gaiellaceae bacterium]|jgi:uncharacterized protein (TIGR03118 family)|nr:hypothetical protein [Gaiellaceae bacterium]